MSSNTVIRIENVSKKFTIRHQTDGAGLRHVIQNAAARPVRMITDSLKRYRYRAENSETGGESSPPRQEEFWAL